jgi:hypothetical protein
MAHFWNVGLLLRDYSMPCPRKLSSSCSPQWEHEVSNSCLVTIPIVKNTLKRFLFRTLIKHFPVTGKNCYNTGKLIFLFLLSYTWLVSRRHSSTWRRVMQFLAGSREVTVAFNCISECSVHLSSNPLARAQCPVLNIDMIISGFIFKVEALGPSETSITTKNTFYIVMHQKTTVPVFTAMRTWNFLRALNLVRYFWRKRDRLYYQYF